MRIIAEKLLRKTDIWSSEADRNQSVKPLFLTFCGVIREESCASRRTYANNALACADFAPQPSG